GCSFVDVCAHGPMYGYWLEGTPSQGLIRLYAFSASSDKMLDYHSLKQDERKFVALTGITPAEFQRLLPAFTRTYTGAFPSTTTQAGRPRQRRLGAGRKAVLLRPGDKLLFILVYQKAYPLQELLGSLFDLSQSRINRWIHRLLPI